MTDSTTPSDVGNKFVPVILTGTDDNGMIPKLEACSEKSSTTTEELNTHSSSSDKDSVPMDVVKSKSFGVNNQQTKKDEESLKAETNPSSDITCEPVPSEVIVPEMSQGQNVLSIAEEDKAIEVSDVDSAKPTDIMNQNETKSTDLSNEHKAEMSTEASNTDDSKSNDHSSEVTKEEEEVILLPLSENHKVVLKILAFSSVPFVDVEKDVEKGGKIVCPFAGTYTKCGFGRLAKWQGKDVAMKEYDWDSKHRFVRELKNYERLREAWGELIPTPFFVGYNDHVFYLGMELAHSPARSDDLSAWYTDEGLFKQLEKRFGFIQLSNGHKHCKYFGGTDGEPKKLITIDLDRCWWKGEYSPFHPTPDIKI